MREWNLGIYRLNSNYAFNGVIAAIYWVGASNSNDERYQECSGIRPIITVGRVMANNPGIGVMPRYRW